jgi:hypothetical protein
MSRAFPSRPNEPSLSCFSALPVVAHKDGYCDGRRWLSRSPFALSQEIVSDFTALGLRGAIQSLLWHAFELRIKEFADFETVSKPQSARFKGDYDGTSQRMESAILEKCAKHGRIAKNL